MWFQMEHKEARTLPGNIKVLTQQYPNHYQIFEDTREIN